MFIGDGCDKKEGLKIFLKKRNIGQRAMKILTYLVIKMIHQMSSLIERKLRILILITTYSDLGKEYIGEDASCISLFGVSKFLVQEYEVYGVVFL